MPELLERDRGNVGRAGHVFAGGIVVVVLIRIVLHADPGNESHHFGKDSTTTSHIQSQILAVVTIYLQSSSIERSFDLFMLRADRCIVGGFLPGVAILLVELLNQTAPAVWLIQQKLFRKSIFCAHHFNRRNCRSLSAHYLALGSARKIKLPNQSGLATPSR